MNAPQSAALERRVLAARGMLRLAVATGRRELSERGACSSDVWDLIDAAALELELRLGELEREAQPAVPR